MTLLIVYLAGFFVVFIGSAFLGAPHLNERRKKGGKKSSWGYWIEMEDDEIVSAAALDYFWFAAFWPVSIPFYIAYLTVFYITNLRG